MSPKNPDDSWTKNARKKLGLVASLLWTVVSLVLGAAEHLGYIPARWAWWTVIGVGIPVVLGLAIYAAGGIYHFVRHEHGLSPLGRLFRWRPAKVLRGVWRSRLALEATLVIFAFVSFGLLLSKGAPPPPTETTKFVIPNGTPDAGGLSLSTASTPKGAGWYCSNASGADTDRPDAHQCLLLNSLSPPVFAQVRPNVLDPCFPASTISSGKNSLVCFTSPFSSHTPGGPVTRGVELGVYKSVTAVNTFPRDDWSRPWALLLPNGVRCVVRVGVGVYRFVTPQDARYECFRPQQAFYRTDAALIGWLTDYPDESNATWTVPLLLRGGEGITRNERVLEAWR